MVADPAGEVLDEHARLLGEVTNNVAEYRALLLGLERARALGATEVEVVDDSELIAKQVHGLYKVKHAAMRPLHIEAMAALRHSSAGRSARCPAPKTPTPTRWSTPRWTKREGGILSQRSSHRRSAQQLRGVGDREHLLVREFLQQRVRDPVEGVV